MRALSAILAGLLAAALAGCGTDGASEEVVVYVSVDRDFAEPILRDVERDLGIAVRAKYDTEETKSTGLVNELLAAKDRPKADVFWSGDPVRAELLRQKGVVTSWKPVSLRGRVILCNTKLVPDPAARPRSVEDLALPRWRGRAAMPNPVFGTTSVHVAAIFGRLGDERARELFERVKSNEVRVLGSNGDVRRAVASGEVAWGILDTDDAATALKDGAPVEMIWPDQGEGRPGALLIPNAIALIAGGPHPDAARRAADWLLRPAVAARLAEAGAGLPGPPPGVRAMEADPALLARELEQHREYLRDFVVAR